jgi:sugar lactone lactonase YvrE
MERVYGQPDFTTNTPNAVTATSLNLPGGAALDGAAGLYIVDQKDNRVLYYPAGSTTASQAIGQPNFTSSGANNGGVSATSLSGPQAVAADGNGGVYVADTYNRRVLHFPAGSTTADRVYGQSSFNSNSRPTAVNASTMSYPDAVAVDGSGGLYVADQSFNRVLYFPPSCAGVQFDCAATAVYGQPNFSSYTANNGGESTTSLHGPEGVTPDGNGGLYIADSFNNRVLHYPAGNTSADRVYGQPDFASSTANNGGVSATTLNIATGYLVGLAADTSGGLYVSDTSNNRVLYYPPSCTGTQFACAASQVYGQTNFTSTAAGTSATRLASPYGVAVDRNGNLFVADGGNNRAVSYPSGSTTASQVYGQLDFAGSSPGTVSATSLDTSTVATIQGMALDSSGGLYLADTVNNRVLYYPPDCASVQVACAATVVYGQPNFSATAANNGGVSASSLDGPTGLALDSSGGLYIADSGNNRVLYFSPGSTTASQVYGQPNFSATAQNGDGSTNAYATGLWQPDGLAVDSTGLYVADAQNSRVVHYPAGSTTAPVGSATADAVYGQASLTASFPSDSGCSSVTAATFCLPQGIAADGSGGLYVTDPVHNRVLFFTAPSANATRVYGQSTFTSGSSGGATPTGLNTPCAVALDSSGNLYVADTLTYRTLFYPAGSTAATREYGQAGLNSYYAGPAGAGTFYRPAGIVPDSSGGVYVADTGDNRALYLPAGSITGLFPRLELPRPTLPVYPSSYHFGLWDTASSAQGPHADLLSTAPGSTQQTSPLGWVYGAGDDAPSRVLDGQFLSAPLAAQTIPAGAWTVGLGIQASIASGSSTEYSGYLSLYVVDGATGNVRGTIYDGPIGGDKTGTGTELTAYGAHVTGAAVQVQAGDYLDAEIGVQQTSYNDTINTYLYTSGTGPVGQDGVSATNAMSVLQPPNALFFQ